MWLPFDICSGEIKKGRFVVEVHAAGYAHPQSAIPVFQETLDMSTAQTVRLRKVGEGLAILAIQTVAHHAHPEHARAVSEHRPDLATVGACLERNPGKCAAVVACQSRVAGTEPEISRLVLSNRLRDRFAQGTDQVGRFPPIEPTSTRQSFSAQTRGRIRTENRAGCTLHGNRPYSGFSVSTQLRIASPTRSGRSRNIA